MCFSLCSSSQSSVFKITYLDLLQRYFHDKELFMQLFPSFQLSELLEKFYTDNAEE